MQTLQLQPRVTADLGDDSLRVHHLDPFHITVVLRCIVHIKILIKVEERLRSRLSIETVNIGDTYLAKQISSILCWSPGCKR